MLFKLFVIGYKIVNNLAPIYLLNSFNLYQPKTAPNLKISCRRDMLILVYKNSVHNQFNINLSKLTQVWIFFPYEIRCNSAYSVLKKILKHILLKRIL